MPERGVFFRKDMRERDQIRPGVIFPAIKEGSNSQALMQVQGVLEDGRVIVNHLGPRRHTALVTNQEVILGGGIVDGGRLGRLRCFGQPSESSEGED